MVKPIGCTYESPHSRLQFIKSMPEVYAMICFFASCTISILCYTKLDVRPLFSLIPFVVGCIATRLIAVGGVSPYIIDDPESENPLACLSVFTDETRPVAVVTGASSGIGRGTMKALFKQGVHVVMAVRDVKKGAQARDIILNEIGVPADRVSEALGLFTILPVDLTDMASVTSFVAAFTALNVPLNFLFLNAGAMVTAPRLLSSLPHNPDQSFATNHLGHFLMTSLLLPKILQDKTRIVVVSSAIHVSVKATEPVQSCLMNDLKTWDAPTAYGRTKICNLWFTNILQQVLDKAQLDSGVIKNNTAITDTIEHAIVTAVHPGTVWSPFHMPYYRDTFGGALLWFPAVMAPMSFFAMKSLEEGAQTSVHCAIAKHPAFSKTNKSVPVNPVVGPQPGQFHAECKVSAVSPVGYDQSKGEELWKLSLEILSGFLTKDKCEHFNLLQL